MAGPLRFAGCFGIAHIGVIGHVGGGRVDGFGGSIGHILGGDVRVLHAHTLHVVGIGGVTVFAGLLLATIFLAFVFFVLGVVAAVLAHFEGIQQVMDDVAELSLVLDQVFQPVEILPRTFFNQRAPQIDEPLGGRR